MADEEGYLLLASLVAHLIKNLSAMRETGFSPWVGKIPWRRDPLEKLDGRMRPAQGPPIARWARSRPAPITRLPPSAPGFCPSVPVPHPIPGPWSPPPCPDPSPGLSPAGPTFPMPALRPAPLLRPMVHSRFLRRTCGSPSSACHHWQSRLAREPVLQNSAISLGTGPTTHQPWNQGQGRAEGRGGGRSPPQLPAPSQEPIPPSPKEELGHAYVVQVLGSRVPS